MKKFFCLFLTGIVLLMTSCREMNGKGNLKILLESPGDTRTLQPDSKYSTVVKYNVRGVGPNGKTFSKDSSSKTISIDGIPMGTWTVSATGYNSESSGIISGSKTFLFDNTVKTISVNMSSHTGTGTAKIDFSWDTDIANPVLKVNITGPTTAFKESYAPGDKNSSFQFSKSGLQAGTYMLNIQLFSGSNLITGIVESLYIVNGKTTSGEIDLSKVTTDNPKSSSLQFIQTAGTPITAHFAVEGYASLPGKMEAGSEQTVKTVVDSTLPNSNPLLIQWYIDGKISGEPQPFEKTNTLTYKPEVGSHIISAVVYDSSTKNSASMYYKFYSKTTAKKGSATYLTSEPVNGLSGLVLAEDSIYGALPEDNFVIITPSRSSMQVFTIIDNVINISGERTYNATDFRFTWLHDVTAIYSDAQMNCFAVKTGNNCIHVLFFDPKTGKIDRAFWQEEPLEFYDFVSMPPCFIDNIACAALVPSEAYGGTIFLFDSGNRSEEILSISTDSSEVKKMTTTVKTKSINPPVCCDGNTSLLCVINAEGILSFAKIQNGGIISDWYNPDSISFESTNDIRLLNSSFAVFRSSSNLKIYEYYSRQRIWVSRTIIDSDSLSFDVSQNGAYIYISDSGGNLHTYRSGLTDNFGKIYTQKTGSALNTIFVNKTKIIGKDSVGNLYIFDIAQEDSN